MKKSTILIFLILFVKLMWGEVAPNRRPSDRKSSCVTCHSSVDKKFNKLVNDWGKSVHADSGVTCIDCHGGNDQVADKQSAMDPQKGFSGILKRIDIPEICGGCHSDPSRMKVFNQRIDQLAEYKSSMHGKLLYENDDPNVATCVDCHNAHYITKVSEATSPVFKMNVPSTCSKCHANKIKMARYGIPTDQYTKYLSSYHAEQLLKKQNTIAPSCADCHGKHGAVPPGLKDITQVCGNCHSAILEFFKTSPHQKALDEVGTPKCIDCHDNHAIFYPTPEKLVSEKPEDRGCVMCHEKGSKPYEEATKIHKAIVGLKTDLNATKDRLKALKETVVNTIPFEESFIEVEAEFTRVKPMVHTYSYAKIQKITKKGETMLASINKEMDKRFKQQKMQQVEWSIIVVITIFLVVLIYLKRKSIPNPYVTKPNEKKDGGSPANLE